MFTEHSLDLEVWRVILVLLLGIFKRAPRPSATGGHPCAILLQRGALPFKKIIFVFKNLLVI
jgi:hypothetical protein